jgi:heme exporter protein C
LAIVGAVNLPIIKYSVVWWNTLHQGATFTVTAAPKMDPSMLWPLLLTFIGFYCWAAALVLYRTCTLILERERQKRWVQEWVEQESRS